jgi:Leucine-rich repeat (LRR) protein
MECFIVEEGVERKAELEDILPLIHETQIQDIFRDAYRLGISLPYVLAHMPVEIKNLVYRNLLARMRGGMEKKVLDVESRYKKDNYGLRDQRARLIQIIEKSINWQYNDSVRIVWKEAEPGKEPPREEPSDPIEGFLEDIERACNSGNLDLYVYDQKLKDALQKAFEAFQGKKNELKKIRSLKISGCVLPAAELLFEAGGIEELEIQDVFDLPPFIRNAVSLRHLSIIWKITYLPEWIREMQSLTELAIEYTYIEKLPDSIGNLISLKELILRSNRELTSLPDSMGNLKNLTKLELRYSPIESLPDWIGNLQNLTELSLCGTKIKRLPNWIGNLDNLDELSLRDNKNLKCLPDSIGKLKKLALLDLSGSAIEKLPDAMANCSSLECIDVSDTSIKSFPDFIFSSKTLTLIQSIEAIPKEHSISYRSFCNSYYILVNKIIAFQIKAWCEGVLALDEDLEYISEDFLREGLRLVVYGTNEESIQHILTLKIEREGNYYKKKLMEIAMEGILCISRRDCISDTCIKLAVMVDIKNNQLDAACAKYLAGDYEALKHIDFDAAILHEKEREEIRFMKRALEMGEISRRKGHFGMEDHLDSDGIAARDVFEYGLSLIVEGWSYQAIDKILAMLIGYEADPMRKNLAMAKKEAVIMIYEGDSLWKVKSTLLSYFDDDVAKNLPEEG